MVVGDHTRVLAHACLLLGLWHVCPEAGRGDGGTVRLSEEVGAYRVTVFTAPRPVRAGPVDVSVMVQRAGGGEPASVSEVTVGIAPVDRPEQVTRFPATIQAATNKLFHAAHFDMPAPGRWNIDIDIDGRLGHAQTTFVLEAAEPLPRWAELWPWFAWLPVPIVLFLMHQVLVRRKAGARLLRP